MPTWKPIQENEENIEESQPKPKEEKSEIEKAREAADIQEQETRRVKAEQEAVFFKNNIESVEKLLELVAEAEKTKAELGKQQYDWERKKEVENSTIQTQRSELASQKAELDKRTQELDQIENGLQIRIEMINRQEELMNEVQKKNLVDTAQYNSIQAQLERNLPQIIEIMGKNASHLSKSGFINLGKGLKKELGQLTEWSENSLKDHVDNIVVWLKGEVVDCNDRAVIMARNPKKYGDSYNYIVDNLEKIYELLPVIKPENMPSD